MSARLVLASSSHASNSHCLLQPRNDLLNEIRHVNKLLVETTVDVDSTEDDSLPEASAGTIIKCSYTAVAVSGDFKSLSSSPMVRFSN
jgi:PAX-interacting protein 1